MPLRSRFSTLGLITVLAALLSGPAVVHADRPLFVLPAQISESDRTRLEEIMRNAFAATRVAREPFTTRAEIFEYLLDHPEFASHVARAVGAAKYKIWHTEEGLWLDEGWGVIGRFTLVHAEPGRRIFHAWGRSEQKLLPDIHGQAVAVLEYAFQRNGDGRALVATTAIAYVQLDSNFFLKVLARVGAPFIQKKADREGKLLLRSFAHVSRDIEANPAEVYRKVTERPDVPRQELAEFRRLLNLP